MSSDMKALWSHYESTAEGLSAGKLKLECTQRPRPSASPGQVLVKLRAAGVNPSDAGNALRDRFGGKKPIIPGRDWAGVIAEAPDEPSLIGTEVYGCSGDSLSLTMDGCHAEYVLLPSDAWAPKPKPLSWRQAGAAGTPYTTAWLALQRAGVREGGGEAVLVVGATGAVGRAAASIARALGCRVITASRRDVTDVNTAMDAELSRVGELTEGRGVDVVIDAAGATELMPRGLKVLAKSGRYVFVSAGRGSTDLTLDAAQLYFRNQTLAGVNSTTVTLAQNADVMRAVGGLWDSGKMALPDEEGVQDVQLEDGLKAYHSAGAMEGKKMVFMFAA